MKKYCESTQCCTYQIAGDRKRRVEKKPKEVAEEVLDCPDCGEELLFVKRRRKTFTPEEKLNKGYF